jgi:hypothetical protein
MAKKKKLTADGIDTSNELDFGDFDFNAIDSQTDANAKSNDRKPAARAFKGAVSGVKDRFANTQFISSILRNSLPEEYGEAIDNTGSISSSARTLYNDAVRDVKPSVRNLASQVNKLVPANFAKSKEFLKKLEDKLAPDGGYRAPSMEQLQEQGVQNMLASVFQSQAEQQAQTKAEDDSKEQIESSIETKRFGKNYELLNTMSMGISRLADYNDRITSAYQRKSLELQFRSYFVQNETLKTTREFFAIFKNQNEAVVKNTALPEYVKIHNSERLKDMLRTKFFENAHQGLFGQGSFVKSAMGKVRGKVKEGVEKFRDRVSAVANAVEEAADVRRQMEEGRQQMDEMGLGAEDNPFDRATMGGTFVGSNVAEWIGKKIGNRVRSATSDPNSRVSQTGFDILRYSKNPAAAAEALAKSKYLQDTNIDPDGNSILNTLKELFNSGKSTLRDGINDTLKAGPDMALETTSAIGIRNAHGDARWTNASKKSLESIIPGYLARIYREIQVLRTGDASTSLTMFDMDKDTFSDKNSIKKSINARLNRDLDSRNYKQASEDAVKKFDTEGKMSKKSKEALKQRLQDLAMKNGDYTYANVLDDEYLATLDNHTAHQLKHAVKKKVADPTSSINKKNSELTTSLMGLKESVGDMRGDIQKYIGAGYKDILKEMGVVDESNDGLSINRKAYSEMLSGKSVSNAKQAAPNNLAPTAQPPAPVAQNTDTVDKLTAIEKLLKSSFTKANAFLKKIEENGRQNGLVTSDEETKKNFSRFDPKKALAGITKLPITKWGYKKGEGDEKEHVGPMAQDVQKEFGNQAAPNGKKLSLITMNGINMSAIKALEDGQEELKSQIGIKPSAAANDGEYDMMSVVQQIKADTTKLVENSGKLSLSFENGFKNFGQLFQTGFDKFENAFGKHFESLSEKFGKHFTTLSEKLGKYGFPSFAGFKKEGILKKLVNGKNFVKKKLTEGKDRLVSAANQLNDRVLSPVGHFVKDKYNANKDDVKKTAIKLYNQGSELLGTVFTKAKNAATDFFQKQLPAGFGALKKGLGIVGEHAKSLLDPVKDIYVTGNPSPVMLAIIMRLGGYFDQETGKVIKRPGDIKGAVVNKDGEVVLTMEDIGKKLIDQDGKPIEVGKNKLLGLAVGIIGKGISNIKKHAIRLKDKVTGFLGNKISSGEGIWKGMKDKVSGIFGKLSNVFDSGNKETNGILKEILDILKERFQPKSLVDQDATQNHPGHWKNLLQTKKDSGKTDLRSAEGANETKYQSSGSVIDKMMSAGKDLLNKSGVKDKFAKSKEWLDKKGITKRATEPAEQTGQPIPEKRTGSWKDRFADMAKAKKQRDKNKSVVQASLDPKYKSSENVIDKMMSFGKSWLDKSKESADAADVDDAISGRPKKNRTLRQAKVLAEKTKRAASKAGKGLVGGIASKGLGLLGGLLGMGKSNDGAAKIDEPAEKKIDLTKESDKKVSLEKKKSDKLKDSDNADKETSGKMVHPTTTPKFNDSDGDGKRDGGWKDRMADMIKAKKQKDKDRPVVQASLDPKYKSDKNIIDVMAEKAMAAFGAIKSGLGGLADMIGAGKDAARLGKLGRFGRLASMGRTALSVGGLVTGAGTAAAGTAGAVGAAGTAAVVGGAATAAGGVGMGTAILGTLGTAAGAIGAFLASPVVLGTAAVALTAYAGYKGIKYLTQNNANKFDIIRLRQYGFGEKDERFYHYVFELEQYLEKSCVAYTNGTAEILQNRVDAEEVFNICNIDKKNKERIDQFLGWFGNRFKPVFLTHLTALTKIDSEAKLSSVEDMKDEDVDKYLTAVAFENGPYSNSTSPFSDLRVLSADASDVKKAIENARKNLRIIEKKPAYKAKPDDNTKSATEQLKEKAEKKEQEQKEEQKAAKVAEEVKSDLGRKSVSSLQAAIPKPDKDPSIAAGAQEGEKKQDTGTVKPESKETIPSGAAKVPLADGPISKGENAAQFIRKNDGSVNIEGIQPNVLANLKGMVSEYGEKTGDKLTVTSGFRSKEKQEELYRKNPRLAAAPGKSLHEFGLALDADSKTLNKVDDMGLMRKYGFTRPVGGEPWHMEPAGIQLDIQGAKKDPNAAAEAVDNSLGHGGGGVGAIPGSPTGKRNNDLAKELLKPSASEKLSAIDEDKDKQPPIVKAVNDYASKDEEPIAQVVKEPDTNDKKNSDTKEPTKSKSLFERFTSIFSNGDSEGEKSPSVKSPASGSGIASQQQSNAVSGKAPVADSGVKADVKQTIDEAAKKTGNDPAAMQTIAAVESSLNPDAKATGSSASGLFQFIRSTWDSMISKYGSKYQLDNNASPLDAKANALMGGEYLKENKKAISSVKPNPNATDLYMAHFLGAGGAKTFFKADPSQQAAEVLPKAASANRSIFYAGGKPNTIGEVYNQMSNKLNKAAANFGINAPPSSPLGGDATKSDKAGSSDVGQKNAEDGVKPSEAVPTNRMSRKAPESQQSFGNLGTSKLDGGASSDAGSQREISQSNLFGFQQQPAQRPVEQSSTFNFGGIGKAATSIDKTLTDSLKIQTDSRDIQNQMLEALNAMMENLSPEKLAEVMESVSKNSDDGNGKEKNETKAPARSQMRRPGQAIPPSVNLKRTVI